MNWNYIHPRDQIALLMERVYHFGMTTTSGGNISVRDQAGDIWITPAGIDKGSLGYRDIVRVKADGTQKGRHRPSSELPFHRAIYEARPDIGGIVHAHPSALVSFSIVRKLPPTRILPQVQEVCGRVAYAPYALPGSDLLGANIAEAFAKGHDCVMLENHGVVCGGASALDAFHKFETLDFCARLAIKALLLGGYRELDDDQIRQYHHRWAALPEFDPEPPGSRERAYRRHISETLQRAYAQQLMAGTEGVISVRLDDGDFLINPTGMDRRYVGIEDVVLVKDGKREAGKRPSRSVAIHRAIYKRHPEINAIVSAQAPNSTAFAISEAAFDSRTIPESYILLRDIRKLPYGPQFTDEDQIADALGPDNPVALLANDAILATGDTLLKAFDRLEVAEFSARSIIDAMPLGPIVAMNRDEIRDLDKHFLGKG